MAIAMRPSSGLSFPTGRANWPFGCGRSELAVGVWAAAEELRRRGFGVGWEDVHPTPDRRGWHRADARVLRRVVGGHHPEIGVPRRVHLWLCSLCLPHWQARLRPPHVSPSYAFLHRFLLTSSFLLFWLICLLSI